MTKPFSYKNLSALSWEYYTAYRSLAHWPQGNTSFKMCGNLAECYVLLRLCKERMHIFNSFEMCQESHEKEVAGSFLKGILRQTQDDRHRNTQNASNCLQKEHSILYMCLLMVYKIQSGAWELSCHELVTWDCQTNLNWQRINCTLIKRKLIWFFIKIGERWRFAWNVFHTILQVSKRAQSQLVKAPDRPVRPTHIVCYSIMEASLVCFNMILKQITV